MSLSTPVRYLKGVGPRAPLLERLRLRTVQDVLFYFPRAYELRAPTCGIQQLEEGRTASLTVWVEEVEGRATSTGKHMLCALFRDEHDYLRGVWFNQPYVQEKLVRGTRVRLTGRPARNGLRWEMIHPQISQIEGDEGEEASGGLVPRYGLTHGLKQARMRRVIQYALGEFANAIPEVLPDSLRREHALPGIAEALHAMHQPRDETSLAAARRRFAFQELLVQQLAFALRRHDVQTRQSAIPLPTNARVDARITRLFPFPLTDGQRQVISEITHDLARTVPMTRLLHGDVGSGKTMVAVYAMLVAAAAGCQVVLMAPTDVLAQQHFETLARLLLHARVRIALWTGAVKESERQELRPRIASGEIGLVVGTQAVVQSPLVFHRLGLVIVDEQHRFGVRQRAWLTEGDHQPHYLVMTATPIPRTMALLAYADLDVSTLRELPPGRQPIHTYHVPEEKRARWWDFYRQQLRAGRQGYVIVPRVDSDEEGSVTGLQQAFESLCHGELSDFKLGLMHGGVPPAEKAEIMQAFREGTTHVLVATSVVEIGVDVPNATVMTIENGERFGLAQLHQLRGRVARGIQPAYVGLFADPGTPAARERIEAFVQSSDGFALAELDLKLRGPGEFFGVRQHGLPRFRVARLPEDASLLNETRNLARSIVEQHPDLSGEEWQGLRKQVWKRYGHSLGLGQVG